MEEVTAEMHQLCLNAADEAVRSRRFAQFAIPEAFHELVAESWRQREATLYGRFDFSWDGEGEPKLLEYNADTPTALLEASVVQWQWLEDAGQIRLRPAGARRRPVQFAAREADRALARPCVTGPAAARLCTSPPSGDNDEDLGTVEYLRDCALQAGWDARRIDIEDLGWDGARFVDLEEAPVATLFKLYPWEWLVREEFGQHLLGRPAALIEPAWKMLLSNKALLVLLWEMNYGHPNLLPAYFTPQKFGADYVKKPLLSREGANVTIRSRGVVRQQPGGYGGEGFVYQGLAPLPAFDNRYPVIGSWIVGDQRRRHRHPRGRFADHPQFKPLRAPLLQLEVLTMDFVKFSLSGFDEFLIYAGLAIAFIYMYMIVYLWVTPYNELKLIKDGNIAAALSLSGAVLGFTFPLAASIFQAVHPWDMMLWAVIAGDRAAARLRRGALLAPKRLPPHSRWPDRHRHRPRRDIDVRRALLNAACMRY